MPVDRSETVPLISQSSSALLLPFLGVEEFSCLGSSSKISWWLGESNSFLTIETSEDSPLPTSLLLPATPRRIARTSPHGWRVDDSLTCVSRLLRTPQVPRRALVASAPESLEKSLRARVGLGSGLTPEGDDEIAGFLLAARALGISHALNASVWSNGQTTALSAALMSAAFHGFALSAVADATHEIALGSIKPQTRDAVLAVGHSSGAALLQGMEIAAHCVRRAA
ncbi:unannotated protein [freshwater metagenome]|uniref:Unannotated protein n=1 Tax=freshwater metagenome TaxID=449393 RepID=A0A6J7B8C0_9ZZZZ|nr:DUF2877 domain-containing protein [Actinomycetota bacterium]MSY51220.1 DUF2877 domain-containing protein [Actinomycetota bacterium]